MNYVGLIVKTFLYKYEIKNGYLYEMEALTIVEVGFLGAISWIESLMLVELVAIRDPINYVPL